MPFQIYLLTLLLTTFRRNIALFEQLILIGALVSSFELRLADEKLELDCLERFNACSGDLFVFSRRRI